MGLRQQLDAIEPHFKPGGRFESWYALYEAVDTIFYSPGLKCGSMASSCCRSPMCQPSFSIRVRLSLRIPPYSYLPGHT